MRAAATLLAICGVAFGGAFAVGSVTRHAAPPAAPKAAPVVAAPAPVASLAPADGLPGLRVVAAKKRPAGATSAGKAVALAPLRRAQVPAAAPTPRTTTPVSRPAPSGGARSKSSKPTTAASGPSVAFFDDGN